MVVKEFTIEDYNKIEWLPSQKRTGKKFGGLTVKQLGRVRRTDRPQYKYYFFCECECWNHTIKNPSPVKSGKVKSCGCWFRGNQFRVKKERGESWFNCKYYAYKQKAEKRWYEFNLSKEQFRHIITQPCIYCGRQNTQVRFPNSRSEFRYTGIDRYDNTKWYVIENCVPCCYICNGIKMNHSIEDLEEHLELMLSRKHIRGKDKDFI